MATILNLLAFLADLAQYLYSVSFGHIKIRDHDIGGVILKRLDAGGAVLGLTDLEALTCEQFTQETTHQFIVINNENCVANDRPSTCGSSHVDQSTSKPSSSQRHESGKAHPNPVSSCPQ